MEALKNALIEKFNGITAQQVRAIECAFSKAKSGIVYGVFHKDIETANKAIQTLIHEVAAIAEYKDAAETAAKMIDQLKPAIAAQIGR